MKIKLKPYDLLKNSKLIFKVRKIIVHSDDQQLEILYQMINKERNKRYNIKETK